MSNVSIGITAMELFAYNPFRILGLPVNASHAEIAGVYENLIRLADSGDIGRYTTPFDFDSLPPFSRSAQTVKTAHQKLASNGYRCFAFADSEFSVSLNIDDIMLNLRDISCYDCFLRCYMWLVINDRNMEEHDLWIQLAEYIDKMIMSKPDEWTKYFDNRFPAEMIDENLNVYKSFYSTFCEIILLPLKEMVRGSMKCRTAVEILGCAGIDINEQFEFIEIPQANTPKPGEPEPKLKLALKYGDEYFDISTGSMRSYSEDTAANESNMFAANTVAPLDADDLFSEPKQETGEDRRETDTTERPVAQSPSPAPEPVADTPKPFKARSRSERRAERENEQAVAAQKTPARTELVAPNVQPLKIDNGEAAATLSQKTPAPVTAADVISPPKTAPKPRRSFNKGAAADSSAPDNSPAAQNEGTFNNPFAQNKTEKIDPRKVDEKKMAARRSSSFSKIVEEAGKKEAEAAAAMYEEEEEDITNALIDILKSSSRGESMKSVDTSHVVSAKEMAGPSHTSASMDNINLKDMDMNRLNSGEAAARKLTREERYRNVKIDDMLGTNAQGKTYGLSPIEQYKKDKEKEKQQRKSLMMTIAVVAIFIIVFVVLFFLGF